MLEIRGSAKANISCCNK